MTPDTREMLQTLCQCTAWQTDEPVEIGRLNWLVLKGYARAAIERGRTIYYPTDAGRAELAKERQS